MCLCHLKCAGYGERQFSRHMAIQLWALTTKGDILRFTSVDVASAERLGKIMVHAGAWRTWDAFDDPPDEAVGRKLVASHAKAEVKCLTGGR